MRALSDGSANSGRPVSPCRSTTQATLLVVVPHADAARAAGDREDAVRQVVEPEAVHCDQPQLSQVRQRLGDRAGPERREPAPGAGEVELPSGVPTSAVTVALLQHHDRVVRRRRRRRAAGVATSTLRKPWCSKPSVAGVAYGVVQTGRALERRLAVERRVDPAGQRMCGRERRGLQPAGAELQSELGRGHLVGGREPGRRVADMGELDVHRDLRLDVGGSAATTTAGRCRPRSSRSRSAISRPARFSPSFAQSPAGPGELPGAAGDHHRQRPAEATHQRQVGVLQDEGADQLGAVLGRPGGVRRGGLVERRVAGREDRGVVDQTRPKRRRVAPD